MYVENKRDKIHDKSFDNHIVRERKLNIYGYVSNRIAVNQERRERDNIRMKL